jgi:hypothetical protein
VFVAVNDPASCIALHETLMATLRDEYRKRDVAVTLAVGPSPAPDTIEAVTVAARAAFGNPELAVEAFGVFPVPEGPISPDHIVYAKSFPLFGTPTTEAVWNFTERNGYPPRIIVTDAGVFAVETTARSAALALTLARDGALVAQCARAFGGVRLLSDTQRRFIETWEAESYRQAVAKTGR